MSVSTFLRHALCIGFIGFTSCHTKTERVDAVSQEKRGCASQLCDQKFSALVLVPYGRIVIRLQGYTSFFSVDGHTADAVIRPLKFIPNATNLDYTAYDGRLDGQLVRSPPVRAPLLLIWHLDHVRRLSTPEAQLLEKSFEASVGASAQRRPPKEHLVTGSTE